MKLFYSPTSPFVRKCLVTAIELGIDDRIEFIPSAAHPINRNLSVVEKNPLGKVPTLVCDDGSALFDSRVICEYLDSVGRGGLYPEAHERRWRVLTQQAVADGLLDAALLARYEFAMRPKEKQWAEWSTGQLEKVWSCVSAIERTVNELNGPITIGSIATAVALGYIDFRFSHLGWRLTHPATAAWYEGFAARPSMSSTAPTLPRTG